MAELPREGRMRAVIDAVRPSVDGGRFAVKRIVGAKGKAALLRELGDVLT